MAQIKLGELLIKANVLQESQLKAALAEQAKWGGKLGEILVRMNMVSEDILVRALSKQLSIPAVNLDALQQMQPHVKAKIPGQTARDFTVLPLQLRDEGKTLVLAMADPLNVRQLDELRGVTKCRIIPNVAGRTAIARAISRFYEDNAELADADTNFKVVDAQGRTVVKSIKDLEANGAAAAKPAAPPPPPAPAPASTGLSSPGMPAVRAPGAGGSPSELLKAVEDVQRKEVAALKAMVELLIEKGVFTRDEYLAKVRR
jgi:Type II secretion system (T2SS), protein E, N-terminal domain